MKEPRDKTASVNAGSNHWAIARKSMEAQALMVQNMLMTLPAFICILRGTDYVFDFVNPQYQQLFGKRELLGKPLLVALPELAGQGIEQLLEEVYQTGEPFIGVDLPFLLARDENMEPELRYFNFCYQPMRDEHNQIFAILDYGYEVTEQVNAKKSNQKSQQQNALELEEKVQQRTFDLNTANGVLRKKNQEIEANRGKLLSEYARSLIEASLDPLITISTKGKITDHNEALVNITGKTRNQLIGSDFSLYFTEPEKASEVYEEVFEKGFVTNYPLTLVDHKLTDVLFNGSVYKDEKGNVLGAVVVARDITEQKVIEKAMLEAKVSAELAAGMAEEAKNKAEKATLLAEDALKSKQQFLSNMSHEIRTPMNAIIGFTKVVLKTELSAKQKEYLTAIKMSGNALIVLINDILDLAKVDGGKMTFEKTPFRMASSISAMLHLFETKIQEKNLVLVKNYDESIPEVLIGDPVRLHQIIMNLVGNAVKFTTTGKITVSVQMLEEDEEYTTVEFAIKDTGIGIAEHKIDQIFENFQQAHTSTSRFYGGTGLGLAIAKQLVERQGGSIQVKSKIDEGSVFSFVMKFEKTTEEMEMEIATVAFETDIKNIKILVVEDMPLNQLLMKTVLEDFGFELDIVANGKLAIEKLQVGVYDIILMDLQMPEMNGFEATEYIRNTMHSTIPIIALTADVTTVDMDKCKAVGMNDYIAKPVDENFLYNKIVGLVTKPVSNPIPKVVEIELSEKLKCIDLEYLIQRTKNNPGMIMEMIAAYLEQTPPLVTHMKQSFLDKNWEGLHAAVHKIIPSFLIMGINPDFESMAKKIQDYARTQLQNDGIHDMVLQLETVCNQACRELEEELKRIKITNP